MRYISLPLLHNVICTYGVLAVTGALSVFDLPWIRLNEAIAAMLEKLLENPSLRIGTLLKR